MILLSTYLFIGTVFLVFGGQYTINIIMHMYVENCSMFENYILTKWDCFKLCGITWWLCFV